MGNESTAIHDLLSGLNRKAIPDDPDDDMLFAGSRRDPLAPPRMARGTDAPPHGSASIPTIHTAPASPTIQLDIRSGHMVVPVPQAFMRQPTHALHGHIPTAPAPVHKGVNKRLYAIAAGLFTIVVVLLGVYLAPVGKRTAAAANVASAPQHESSVVTTAAAKPAPVVESAPVVTLIEPTKPAPVVTPIEVPAPTTPAVADALPKDAVAPPAVVPASAFSAKYEPTVPTGSATAPAAVVTPPAPAPVAETPVTPAPAPKAKAKSRHELAREKRAAKRAAKVSKSRVAAAESPAAPVASSAVLKGNGALEISSGSPREVWVDGRNSKRMTPLRVLLKPGKHTVTLFDKSTNKAKSFDVEIKPNATTKVAK